MSELAQGVRHRTVADPAMVALLERIDQLTTAVQSMAGAMGTRLTRQQLADRLGVHRNTLTARMAQRNFPRPGADGKWLLSDIVQWEQNP